jgi:L-ascorbate metabolism protein UlaG (beta-lactamase superfamily)
MSSHGALHCTPMMSDAPGRPDGGAGTVDLAITWLGHATMLVEMNGMRVLTDPVLRDRVGPLVRLAPGPRPDDVGAIDCVLLSHLHADHTDVPTLRALPLCGPVFAPHPARPWLTSRGLCNVRELQVGQEARVQTLQLQATLATHDPRRRPLGPTANPVGYVIRGSHSVYFAGDTDLFLGMAELRGKVDVALLPVWGWGSRLGAGHLDPDRAAAATALIAPSMTIPIHWGTFALGRPVRRPADPQRPAREFAALVEQYAPGVEVRVLAPGERITFPSLPRPQPTLRQR